MPNKLPYEENEEFSIEIVGITQKTITVSTQKGRYEIDTPQWETILKALGLYRVTISNNKLIYIRDGNTII